MFDQKTRQKMAYYRRECTGPQPLSSAVSSHSPAPSRCFDYNCYKSGIATLLLWNILVGCGYQIIVYGPFDIISRNRVFAASAALGAYSLLGMVQMLYPIGGLMADIRCGRYKIIVSSIIVIWCGFLFGGATG